MSRYDIWSEFNIQIDSGGVHSLEDRRSADGGYVRKWVEDAMNGNRPWTVIYESPSVVLLSHNWTKGYFYLLVKNP